MRSASEYIENGWLLRRNALFLRHVVQYNPIQITHSLMSFNNPAISIDSLRLFRFVFKSNQIKSNVRITGCHTKQWCRFHGNESTNLRSYRKGTQPSSTRCYLLPQAYQKGSARQSSIQEILLRKPRPQGQA